MKKILFLIDSLQGGGAERALLNLVSNLDPSRYEITVRTLYDTGIYIKKLPKYVHYESAKIKGFRGINYFFKMVPALLLHKLYIHEKYDLEIAFLEGISTKIVSGSKSGRKIAWVRIDVLQHKRAEVCYINKNQIIKCYNKFAAIAFVGSDAQESFIKRYGIKNNLYVVRNIFEYSDMLRLAHEKVDFSKYLKPVFVSAGRLEKQKGYDRLLSAHKRLIDEGMDHTIIILGKGEEENKLKEKIVVLGVESTFVLAGFNENPFKYIKNADWFISSSRFEGFSSVIRESVLLEIPIIATDCSGVKEVLGNNCEYGILVENSEQGIYDGIKKIIKFPELRKYYHEKIAERKKIFDYEETVKINRKFISNIVGE